MASETGDRCRMRSHLAAARRAAVDATPRERSAIEAVTALCGGRRRQGYRCLLRHLRSHPTDAFLLNVAVPTIAFSGVTEISAELWPLVESVAGHYGEDWWFLSLLAFVRQEQERYDEAMDLACRAMALEPRSGHAVHARTHVHYETDEHSAGLRWLDSWLSHSRTSASAFRGHASWHAALHELCLGDAEAVRRRWDEQLAPPHTTGLRVLVDAASLLHRCELREMWRGTVPAEEVLAAAGPMLLARPRSPFAALHAGLALASARDAMGLATLCTVAAGHSNPTWGEVVVPILDGLRAQVEGRHDDAATLLGSVLPRLHQVGGSAAQRGVVGEAMIRSLLLAGRVQEAQRHLVEHLDAGQRVHWLPPELRGADLVNQ